jgi:hypothetical protein
MHRGLVLIWLSALFLAACGTPAVQTEATITGEVIGKTATGAEALFQDDFSDPNSGWSLSEETQYLTRYEDGELRLFADNDASPYGYRVTYVEQSFADVSVEVDVRRVSGDDAAHVYLVCRRVDGDNYVFGDVNSEGDARVGALVQGEQQIAADVEGVNGLQEGPNHVRLDCVGNQAALYVNGTLVASAQVDGPAMGGVGLSAGGAGQGQNDFRFDNFAVYAP